MIGRTVCTNILGIDHAGTGPYNPSLAPGLLAGVVLAVGFAWIARWVARRVAAGHESNGPTVA